jgi:glycosyltransferase involved in cell wall biosynthesis
MNVLIVTFLVAHSPSGVVTYYQTLAKDLKKKGVNVQVIDPTRTPFFWNKSLNLLKRIVNPLGIKSRIFYEETSTFARLYLAVRKVRKENFSVIHAQDVRSGVAAYMALGKKVPIVLTCHFNDDPVTEYISAHSLSQSFVGRITEWYKWLFSYVKSYVFVSNYAYEKSKHLLPADINKIIQFNTVQVPELPAREPRADPGKLLISNVGYVDERKNQELLIRAGQELRKKGITNFAIWLIGDGPKRKEYEQLVQSLDLTDHVHFHGRQPAPWKLVAQTDLYIHTALNDNCPYSIIEAFAVKTPVLALPVGGVPELLPDERSQLHSANAGQVAEQIIAHLDAGVRKELADSQAIFASQNFNHELALDKLIDFYRKATI